jgi:diguanylate cyclase (GGDEF)-like protein
MKIAFLPDLAAMATLLTILYFLRRRHPQEGVGLWIVGLLFIFLEAIAYALYMPSGPRHIPMHIVALDSYLAAGVIFLWAASQGLFPRRATLLYLIATVPALASLETTYALDVRHAAPYRLIVGLGFALGITGTLYLARGMRLTRSWGLVAIQLLLWGLVWRFVSIGMYRDAAYIPLFLVYLLVAVVFGLSLPRKSLGKIAIVGGFTVWSLVFLGHSWVTNHPQYLSFASEIWDWQKFLVTIGMLLVMLERKVTSNEWFALHDQLTGLANRRCFEERLDDALKEAQREDKRVAVVMIDLNGFKLINDSWGHETGDCLLQQIADALRAVVRPIDTLARLGGDEFILVATQLPRDLLAAQILEMTTGRILEALSRPFSVDDKEFSVSGSVGVAIYPDDTTNEVLLRRLADQRMYQQKRQVPVAQI